MIRSSARATATEILTRIEKTRAYSNLVLAELARAGNEHSDEYPVIQRMVRGVLEHRASIDAALSGLLRHPKGTPPPFIMNLLRIGIYQLKFLDRVPDHLIVNESVEIAKRGPYKRMSGFVNAILRQVARDLESNSAPRTEELSDEARLDHPAWMIDRWRGEFGIEMTDALCAANNRVWPVFLRVNPLRASAADLIATLHALGGEAENASFARNTVKIISLPRGIRIHELPGYLEGHFYVQDESSILVTDLIHAQPHERVVDLCSAPGGKTAAMALSMENQGEVHAVEIHARRLELVRENCQRLGVSCVSFHLSDARVFQIDPLFDAVLVDVPCSGLGVLGRRADARWNKREEEIEELVPLQLEILVRAAALVRNGGRIVYSTCTIERAENEEIIAAFLKEHPSFSPLDAKSFVPGEVVSSDGFLRTWPHIHGCAGAFGALLIKKN